MNQKDKIKIAVFASGGGSNARKIFEHFQDHKSIEVSLCLYNNPKARVVDHCDDFNIKHVLTPNEDFISGEKVIKTLSENNIDYIVLAGFLRKIPENLVDKYPEHIINIHPALLPKYGGKGMYGMNVHRAVKENNEVVSGPTIHLVNNKYDDGAILAQFETKLHSSDSAEDIQKKVLKLEHQYFARVIESYILEQNA